MPRTRKYTTVRKTNGIEVEGTTVPDPIARIKIFAYRMEHTTVQSVIDVCVQAFNACAPDLGYSDWSAAQLPVRSCHLTEKGTGYTTSDCRQLTTYVIATHYVTRDPFVGRERLLTYSAIGDLFGRTHGWASYALVEACKMLEDPKWKKVYQRMVDALTEQGCELWNAKVTGECAKRA